MSWLHHVDESDRERLERMAAVDLARVVRMAFVAGLWQAGQKARSAQGLPPVRRPMTGRKLPLEERLDAWVEVVVSGLYDRAGRPGVSHLAWLEGQFRALTPDAEDEFRGHDR